MDEGTPTSRRHRWALLAIALVCGNAAACKVPKDIDSPAQGKAWIVTDRVVTRAAFGDEAGTALSYAIVARRLDDEAPVATTQSDRAQWLTELDKELDSSAQDVVWFIHGSGQTFNDVGCIAAEIAWRYRVVVVALDWAMTSATKDYAAARRRVEASAARFGPALPQLADDVRNLLPQGRRTSLLAHSMGNYMLQVLAERHTADISSMHLTTIVLSAADVVSLRHNVWLDTLGSAGTKLIVLINPDDNLLVPMSGKGGLFGWAKRGFAHASEGDIAARLGSGILLGSLSSHAFYVDLSSAGVDDRHEYYVASSLSRKPPPPDVATLISDSFSVPLADLNAERLHLIASKDGILKVVKRK